MIQSKFGKNDVEVRLARAEDKAAVLAFCEQTWEHQEDYIHQVWDKWLADETGHIFVAVVDGLPVAMRRVVLMSDDEAWWEGLRVDPNYRGQGLVSVLRSPMEQYLLAHSIRISRNCVSSNNTIMKGIMARRGHEKVGSYAPNQRFWIGYVNGTTEDLPILLLELRRLAHHKGYQSIGGIFPIGDLVLKSLEVADYRRIAKEEYWVYEWQNCST